MDDEALRRLDEVEAQLERLRKADVPTAIGTAFPSSPGTNLLFYRTDLGFWCYYDGTQWLTVHEYYAPIVARTTWTATNTLVDVVIRTNFAPYVTRVITGTNVAATNDGSNFWTITIAGINSARTLSSTIETFATSADTAGTETLRDNAPTTTATPSNRTYFRCIGQKTGTPGNMGISHSLYYRLIVT